MTGCHRRFIGPLIGFRLLIAVVVGLFIQAAASAQDPASLPKLPQGILSPTEKFKPAVLIGVDVNPDEPFTLTFFLDPGDETWDPHSKEAADEIERLVKYFLTSLTLPDDEQWVNLSPYERERIVPDTLGLTLMGEDLLAADYTLKTLAASLLHPQYDTGRLFWERAYDALAQHIGRTDIPLNTFNKLWIVPESAQVIQKGTLAVINKAKLKVLTEGDYVALMETYLMSRDMNLRSLSGQEVDEINELSHRLFKEIVLPVIVKEVNEGRHFARLRQIYHSVILATWYKRYLKELILNKIYADQEKIAGVQANDPWVAQKIYFAYLNSVKQGVYQFITTDEDPVTRRKVLRRHFSGGVDIVVALPSPSPPTYALHPVGRLEITDEATKEPVPSGNVFAVRIVLAPVEGPWTPPEVLNLRTLPVKLPEDIVGPEEWVAVDANGQSDVVSQLLSRGAKIVFIQEEDQDQWPQEWKTDSQAGRLVKIKDVTTLAKINERPIKAVVLSVYHPIELTEELVESWKNAGVTTVVGVADGVFTNPNESLDMLQNAGISVRLPAVMLEPVEADGSVSNMAATSSLPENPPTPVEPGGVNLNPVLLNLELKRDEQGHLLPFDKQPLERFKDIPGFVPVIQTIHPIDLKAVLDAA